MAKMPFVTTALCTSFALALTTSTSVFAAAGDLPTDYAPFTPHERAVLNNHRYSDFEHMSAHLQIDRMRMNRTEKNRLVTLFEEVVRLSARTYPTQYGTRPGNPDAVQVHLFDYTNRMVLNAWVYPEDIAMVSLLFSEMVDPNGTAAQIRK